jgi:alpha-tubulin suppressor-like RCC1 family protein
MVAAGNAHSLALTSTGSVLAWGYNKYGQLGNGKTANSNMPVKVKLPKGTKVTGVCTGYSDSLALTSSGSVLAWGYNKQGELGDGTSKRSTVPVKVKLPKSTKATAIACGIEHGLVLTSKDSVLAWGYDKYGQLGNGKTANSKVPVKAKLPKGTKVTAIAGGANFSLVRTSHGSLLSWGYNGDGELGDGNNANSALPVPVELPTGVTAEKIAPGGNMALTSTGSLLAWGYNFFGQVGDGTTFNRQLPVPVDLPTGTKVITIASGPAADHSLALVR